MNTIEDNLKRLQEISELEYDWNKNGADKFSKSIISRVENIIRNLSVQPMIFPTACKSIQLEYEKQNGDYLEFEVYENGSISMFLRKSDEKRESEYIGEDDINKIVVDFWIN